MPGKRGTTVSFTHFIAICIGSGDWNHTSQKLKKPFIKMLIAFAIFPSFQMKWNWTFSLWCVLLMKSGSLNWHWSTKILGQFITRMRKNWLWYWKLFVSVTSPIKTITSVLKILTYIVNSITAYSVGLAAILVIMYVSIFKTDVILYKLVHANLIREDLEALTVKIFPPKVLKSWWNSLC